MSVTAAQASGPTQIALWSVVLILATIAGFWFALWLRKRLTSDDGAGGEGLTLGSLRAMHAQGDIDDDEYEAARAAVLAQAGVNPDSARPVHGPSGFERTAEPGKDLAGDPLPEASEGPPEPPISG